MGYTLFAPQVRAIQPAFVNGEDAIVYFSFSAYNTLDQINKIQWRLNSGSWNEIEKNYINKKDEDEYYFIISSLSLGVSNQYYQLQMRLVGSDGNFSAASRISLIRPIPKIAQSILEISKNGYLIEGSIAYSDGSEIETIASYHVEIRLNGELVNIPNEISNSNFGLNFTFEPDCYLLEGATYEFTVIYTTINGYVGKIIKEQQIESLSGIAWVARLYLFDNEDCGAIRIELYNCGNLDGAVEIQRSSEDSDFRAWESMTKINKTKDIENIAWRDHSIEGGKIYKYRAIFTPTENELKYICTSSITVSPTFEDIFLSNKDYQLAIRYNPKITNFKWVTQEAVINTLGGKYPFIRKSGETKYRQFSLSGTIALDSSNLFNNTSIDSIGRKISNWNGDTISSLFLSQNEAKQFKPTAERISNNITDMKVYEKRFRDLVMNFLTNGKPKFFKSFQEGNMIVYLSNISFTPNAQLGRQIYDFSATATEICEPTEKNILKYSLERAVLKYYYLLEASVIAEETDTDEDGNMITYYIPYISYENLFDAETLILVAKEEEL